MAGWSLKPMTQEEPFWRLVGLVEGSCQKRSATHRVPFPFERAWMTSDTRVMITHPDIQPERAVQREREGLFAWLVGAFMHRDFVAFDEAVAEDVVTELPGSSWLAGTHRGRESFGRHMVALRQVLRSAETPTTYLHGGNQMIARHQMMVRGPKHQVEMVLRIKVRFDEDGKIASSAVEPEDLGLFDHVANSTLKYFEALEIERPLPYPD